MHGYEDWGLGLEKWEVRSAEQKQFKYLTDLSILKSKIQVGTRYTDPRGSGLCGKFLFHIFSKFFGKCISCSFNTLSKKNLSEKKNIRKKN